MSDTVNQLQLLQQNLESLLEQKKVLQEQLFELDSAKQSLPGAKKAYKIVGKLLIAKETDSLTMELEEEHKQLELHMSEIEAQEQAIKEKMRTVQKELLDASN